MLAGRVGALDIYRLRDEPRAIILVAYQVRLEGDVQRRRNLSLFDRAIQTCATIYRSGLLKDRLQTGTAAARIFRPHRRTAMTTISPDGVYAQPKSKTPSSRKVWPRFEEVVPYAEPRHGRGPEGGVPLNSGVGPWGARGTPGVRAYNALTIPQFRNRHAAWHTDGAAARNAFQENAL